MILFSQCEMEIIKVEPEIHTEAVLLVSHSEDSQYHMEEKNQSEQFTFISVKPEDKVRKTVTSVPLKNHRFKYVGE
jgi:hypothetical protein